MTCDRVAELLPDWLEGERGGELADLQDHLDGCRECRTIAEDLQRIIIAAAALPVREPGSDLWPGIADRISTLADGGAAGTPVHGDRGTGDGVGVGVIPIQSGRSQLSRWRAPLAVAAAALLVVLGSLNVLPNHPVGDAGVAGTTATAGGGAGATLVSDQQSGGELLAESYGREIAAMAALLETQRSVLDTATVAVLERNLAIIDAAIAESREALEQDPASALLTEQLHTAYSLKLDIMRRAVLLTSGA